VYSDDEMIIGNDSSKIFKFTIKWFDF